VVIEDNEMNHDMEQRVAVARRPAFAASDWVNAAAWCYRPLPGSRFIFSSSRGTAQVQAVRPGSRRMARAADRRRRCGDRYRNPRRVRVFHHGQRADCFRSLRRAAEPVSGTRPGEYSVDPQPVAARDAVEIAIQ